MVHNDPSAHAIPVTATNDATAIPVASMVESIVGCKWSVGLLRLLAGGCSRPSALLRASPGLSTKVMNERLRKMLRFGIVQRTVFGDKPPVEVDYALTPFGRRFMGIIEEVRRLQEAVDSGATSESAAIRKGAARRGRPTSR
jgi:DNA-binding HxlR family transcriptional regulator